MVDDYEPVVEQLDAAIRQMRGGRLLALALQPGRANLRPQTGGALTPRGDRAARRAGRRSGRGRYGLIDDDLQSYFRDVHDHLARMAGHVASFRELLNSVLTANLTQASVRQNEDVRKISAWAAIIAVPTLITGIYGMNFDHMPELGWRLGYPAALALMALLCLTLYRYFHKVGWL